MLVDVDLIGDFRSKVRVEKEDHKFLVDIQYENLPEFCIACKSIGHSISNCR